MRSLGYCNYPLKLLEPHQISHSPPSLRITPGGSSHSREKHDRAALPRTSTQRGTPDVHHRVHGVKLEDSNESKKIRVAVPFTAKRFSSTGVMRRFALRLRCFAHHRMRHGYGPAAPPQPPM